jgi:hypothetical protein
VEERRGVSSNALLVEEASSSLDDVDNSVVVACLQGAVVVVPSCCLRWGVGEGMKVVAAADSWLGRERRDFLDGTIV